MLAERPAQRDSIIAALHAQYGNAFVTQVLDAMVAGPRAHADNAERAGVHETAEATDEVTADDQSEDAVGDHAGPAEAQVASGPSQHLTAESAPEAEAHEAKAPEAEAPEAEAPEAEAPEAKAPEAEAPESVSTNPRGADPNGAAETPEAAVATEEPQGAMLAMLQQASARDPADASQAEDIDAEATGDPTAAAGDASILSRAVQVATDGNHDPAKLAATSDMQTRPTSLASGEHQTNERTARPADHPTARKRSTARTGSVSNISIRALLRKNDPTALVPGIQSLLAAMAKDGIRVGDRRQGLEALITVVAAHESQVKELAGLPPDTSSAELQHWLNEHMTIVVPTRNPGGKSLRTAPEIVEELTKFLKQHKGSLGLIDEAGAKRFELVEKVARQMAGAHGAMKGRWGAYVSATPQGLNPKRTNHGKARPVVRTLRALQAAGASVTVEGYAVGANHWQDRKQRFARANRTLDILRTQYHFANPGLVLGVDEMRLAPELAELHFLEDRQIGSLTSLTAPQVSILRKDYKAFGRPPLPKKPQPLLAALKARLAALGGRREALLRSFLVRRGLVAGEARRSLGPNNKNVDLSSWVTRLSSDDEAADQREIVTLPR